MSWKYFTIILILALLLGVSSGFLYWTLSDLPQIKSLETYRPIESTMVYSSEGKILAEFYLERRKYIPPYQIPDKVKKAFVAIEDQRFYTHPGVDIIGILRALYKNIKAKGIEEGGSTITQQLTKMLFLKPEKSITRKIKEAIIAAQIEKRYTKDEILGMYLNQSYFGTRSYGIEAASETYFGKSVTDLSIAESALLAGLQKAPTAYSPFKNPEKSKARRNLVLSKMLESKFISKEEYERSIIEPLPKKPNFRRYEAPYFIEYIRQQLEARYGENLYTSGMRIYSSLNYKMQKFAEESVIKGIADIEKRVKKGVQASLIAIDLRDGAIKALVGGTDFWETQFNRATMAFRQPGSAFKPFVYATAIKEGMSDSDEILDEPVNFPGSRPNTVWSPKNYDNEYRGYVTLKTAIALSLNTATVRLAHNVGIKKIIDLAYECGIKSKLQPYLPISLGASDVIPIELTVAYGAFATGKKLEPYAYDRITDNRGTILEERPINLAPQKIIFEPEELEKIKGLLSSVVTSGTAQKAKELKKVVYGKTGTTNDFSDAWFVGFDDSLVVGVWVGRDNHKPIGNKEAGARSALPIWIDFMKKMNSQISIPH
ncbi:MAG TPA: PBP1A family penicillin-binding protein [Nitrospirae bacterium]|nr:PBP1A family penicillin-binding protein [Nitrospirota bacterium]